MPIEPVDAESSSVPDESEFDTQAFARQTPDGQQPGRRDESVGLKSDKDAQLHRGPPKGKVTPNVNLSKTEPESEPEEEEVDSRDEEVFELKVGAKTYQAKGIEALKAAAQRGMASQQAATKQIEEARSVARRAQEMMREAEETRRLMKTDPAKAFRDMHGDRAEELMESILLDRAKEHAELQDMTPREREMFQAQKDYKAKLAGFEKQQETQRQAEDEQLVTDQRKQIEGVFTEALTKHDLPVTNMTVRVMAAIYKANIEQGVEMTAEQAATATKLQLDKVFGHITKNMTGERFVKQYPDLAQSIRQHFVKVRNTPDGGITEVTSRTVKPAARKAPRASSDAEWNKQYDRLRAQGDRDLERMNKGKF